MEQVAHITFVMLFAGLVSTETCYAGFGICYQVMGFSITHQVYRGLTALLDGPWLIVAYLIVIDWLAKGSTNVPSVAERPVLTARTENSPKSGRSLTKRGTSSSVSETVDPKSWVTAVKIANKTAVRAQFIERQNLPSIQRHYSIVSA